MAKYRIKKLVVKNKTYKKKRVRHNPVPKAPYGINPKKELKQLVIQEDIPGDGDSYGMNAAPIRATSYDGATAYSGGAAYAPLQKIVQGAAVNQRIGRQIKVKYIIFKYSMNHNYGSVFGSACKATGLVNIPPGIVRVVAVWDSSPNNTPGPMSFQTLFGNHVMGFLKPEYVNRFAILYDKTHNMNSRTAQGNATGTDEPFVRSIVGLANSSVHDASESNKATQKFIKVNRVTTFAASTDSYADITTGSIILYAVTDNKSVNATETLYRVPYTMKIVYDDS